jgi:hypothetical protein
MATKSYPGRDRPVVVVEGTRGGAVVCGALRFGAGAGVNELTLRGGDFADGAGVSAEAGGVEACGAGDS